MSKIAQPPIVLPKDTRYAAARTLSKYLKDKLNLEVNGFDAVFLLDFIIERLGPLFYNQGLYDAQAILAKKSDEIDEAILGAGKRVKP